MFTKCIVFILAFTAAHCDETVRIDLYYMKFCHFCKKEYAQLVNLTSELADYINLHTYPIDVQLLNNSDGVLSVNCSIQDEECYANRIQLCAIEALIGLPTPKGSPFKYIEFNNCVIHREAGTGTVEECGKPLNIPEAILNDIKVCVNGLDGKYLQIKGAWIRKRDWDDAHKNYVPYIVVNGKEAKSGDLIKDVCEFIKNPPPVCSQHV